MRTWRSLGSIVTVQQTRGSYESLWKDLFYQFHQDKVIAIESQGSPENTWSVRVYYDPADSPSIPATPGDQASAVINVQKSEVSSIRPITFEHTDAKNEKQLFKPLVSFPQGLVLGGGGPSRQILAAFYSSSFAGVVTPSEIANQFSELDKKNKTRPVIAAIRKIYPRITSLSVQTESGNPLLYCETKGLSEKVPVSIESGGTHKLTSLLLGIASQPNGVILIDELENGFYYKKLAGIWDAMLDFCSRFDVQVFVSTHSKECLQAVLPTLQGNEDEFRLIRTEYENQRRSAKLIEGDELEAAIETETEVR